RDRLMDPLATLLDVARVLAAADPALGPSEVRKVLAEHGIARLEDAPEPLASGVRSLLDVASQRAVEREELLRARERAQMLSEASFEGIMIHVDGSIIDANQPLADMLSCTHEEVLGPTTMQRCVVPEDLPDVLKRLRDRYE